MAPASSGEMTQEATMPPRPAIPRSRHIVGRGSGEPEAVPTIVMPTTPPTIACVVETGILPNVASSRKTQAPMRAASMPTAYTDMRESQ